jgi:hypothetical protein
MRDINLLDALEVNWLHHIVTDEMMRIQTMMDTSYPPYNHIHKFNCAGLIVILNHL